MISGNQNALLLQEPCNKITGGLDSCPAVNINVCPKVVFDMLAKMIDEQEAEQVNIKAF